MSRGVVNTLAALLVGIGLVGFVFTGHVVFVLVFFAGCALKIEDWISGR